MSAPYSLVIADRAGICHTETFVNLQDVATAYDNLRNAPLDIYVHGDGYDIDIDGEGGMRVSNNGLTEEEEEWLDAHNIDHA